MCRVFIFLAGFLGVAHVSPALGPHQIALIVNEESSRSMTLANHYAWMRKIPLENRIHVRLPSKVLRAEAQLTAAEFGAAVLQPVQRTLKERGIKDRILAWVYSGDFPVRITGSPTTSLTGYTLVQGELPEAKMIKQGKAPSRFFAGIPGGGAEPGPGYPFIAYRQTLKDEMPVPSMLLAHLGARGLTLEQAVEVIRQGIIAEGSMPGGTVYFETGSDVRTRTREFQFPAAIEALKARQVKAEVVKGLPDRTSKVLGLLAGRTTVSVPACGSLLPGAYADHLTSFAAIFSQYHQTKCTEWLRYGATGTSGPVVEPLSIWTKFPSARLFEFYGRGFTLIESLFASTASPFQILFMGEPLSAPFNQRLHVALLPVSGDVLEGEALLQGHTLSPVDARRLLWRLTIDGNPRGELSRDPSFRLDTTALSDGYHAFGVETYFFDQPLIMGFSSSMMEVSNLKRKVDILFEQKTHDESRPLELKVEADSAAEAVGLEVSGVLYKTENQSAAGFTLPPGRWGSGPVAVQAVAHYPDGMKVRSDVKIIRLEKHNQPPTVQVSREELSGEEIQWTAQAEDPDGDAVGAEWFAQLLKEPFSPTQAMSRAYLHLVSEKTNSTALGVLSNGTSSLSVIEARMRPRPSGRGIASGARFGLVYQYTGKDNFSFFGYGGENGSWVLARVQDGQWSIQNSFGRPVFFEEEYELRLEQASSNGVMAWVNGERVFQDLQAESFLGACGVYAERLASAVSLRVNLDSFKGAAIADDGWTATWSSADRPERFESIELKVKDEWGADRTHRIEW